MLPALLFALVLDTNWRDLVQKPHEKLPLADLGLKPLLETPGGKKITSAAEWDKQRQRLRAAWMERLGPDPARPDKLDIRTEKTEKLDGHQRRLLRFASEGDDVLQAYLLMPGPQTADTLGWILVAEGAIDSAVVLLRQAATDLPGCHSAPALYRAAAYTRQAR